MGCPRTGMRLMNELTSLQWEITALKSLPNNANRNNSTNTRNKDPPRPAAPPATTGNIPATTSKSSRSYAAAASTGNSDPKQTEFTEVSHEKKQKTTAPFLNPEDFLLNRQVIMETAGPNPGGVTSDSLKKVINRKVAIQKLQILALFFSASGRIKLGTSLSTSADTGVALRQEIYQVLDTLDIEPTNIKDNSRCTK